MPRLTAEVLAAAPSRMNPCDDYELDLRGLKIPAIENLGLTEVRGSSPPAHCLLARAPHGPTQGASPPPPSLFSHAPTPPRTCTTR